MELKFFIKLYTTTLLNNLSPRISNSKMIGPQFEQGTFGEIVDTDY